VGGLDAGGVEHRHGVSSHLSHRVRAWRPAAAPDAAIVERQHGEATGKYRDRAPPARRVHAETHDEQYRRAGAGALVIEIDAGAWRNAHRADQPGEATSLTTAARPSRSRATLHLLMA
jgi:hypothetical protein